MNVITAQTFSEIYISANEHVYFKELHVTDSKIIRCFKTDGLVVFVMNPSEIIALFISRESLYLYHFITTSSSLITHYDWTI